MAIDIRPDQVAIYIRWSTDDQAEGTTLETQREACLFHARGQGHGIVPDERIFIDDGYSGSTLDRPAMARLRQRVSRGEIRCVIVNTIDRLSRNIVDAVNLVLEEWDGVCYVKCVRQPIDTTGELGRMIFSILATFADFERGQIRARTWSGKVKRAAQGRNPGWKLAFGYSRGPAKGDIVVNAAQAPIVRRVFDLYAAGGTFKGLAERLNHEGTPGPGGRPWDRSAVRYMIRNPMYVGRLEYGRTKLNERRRQSGQPQRVRPAQPLAAAERPDLAIVDQSTWDHCQQLVDSRAAAMGFGEGGARTSGRALTSEYLLTGLLRCRCGYSMTGFTDTKTKAAMYRCNGRTHFGPSFCTAGTLSARELDQFVTDKLLQLRTTDMRQALHSNLAHGHEEQLRQLQATTAQIRERLAQLEGEKNRLRTDYRAGVLKAEDYNEMTADIERERLDLTSRLEQSQSAAATQAAAAAELAALERNLTMLDEWDDLTMQQRKAALRELVSDLVAYRPVRSKEPVAISLTLRGISTPLN